MNRMVIAGNVGKDPELKYSNAGMAILKFSVADTSGKDDKKKTIWHSVTAFGDLAENAAAALSKGTRVVIEGKLTEDKYTNKDGVEVTRYQVLADDVMLSVKWGAPESLLPAKPAPADDDEDGEEPF